MATTLDPQFLEPYYYGALILPTLNPDQGNYAAQSRHRRQPGEGGRLYQHLGYILLAIGDYHKASDVGLCSGAARIPRRAAWMMAMMSAAL